MSNRTDDPDDLDDGDLSEDEMFAHRERYGSSERGKQRPRVVPDFVRRAIENTVGQVTNTGTLSRDALNYLLQQGDRGKREIVRVVAHEVGEFLRGVDLSSEVIKVLTGVSVEMSASIRFKPTKDGVTPEIGVATNVTGPGEPEPSEPLEGEPRDEAQARAEARPGRATDPEKKD